MNTMALNTVYNHYLTSYAPKSASPYDTHKKSELRSIYNSIIKLNKDAPLYMLDTGKETQEFAVGIKEGARELRNTIASLGGLNEAELLNKKTAYSSNQNIADAKFIGSYAELEAAHASDQDDFEVPSFAIEVKSLANGQTNIGTMLNSNEVSLKPDSYSFDIESNDLNYEFQFNINEGDSNKDVQTRLSRLITNANIGVEASVLEDGEGMSALKLQSSATGLSNKKDTLFTVSDQNTSKTAGAVDYFGIGEITKAAANSNFIINGNEQSTASNTFTVEKMYEVTLNGISSTEGETATIALKPDVESLTENIKHLVGGYNDFIQKASEHAATHPKANRLLSEMKHISSYYDASFGSIGLHRKDDGLLDVNEKQLQDSISAEDAKERFSSVKDFTGSLLRKSSQVSLNPMNYVDKTIVAYKNPGKSYASPYVTSTYSGMMFNGYC
ncbi:MAG: flagellar capping protein [Lachnospiraceae bacterium]